MTGPDFIEISDEEDDDFLMFDVDAIVANHESSKKKAFVNEENKPSQQNISETSDKKNSQAFQSMLSSSFEPVQKRTASQACAKNPANDEKHLLETLQQYYGFDQFREGQMEVIQALLNGKDANVLWATGSGKSLCFSLPAIHSGKVAFVVSPLISLMQDQVNNFNNTIGANTKEGAKPLKACFLGSAQRDSSVENDVFQGKYTLCLITPEKVAQSGFLERVRKFENSDPNGMIALFAIDESHCVSEWGHDFRKEYRQLSKIREMIPNVPIGAFTATATLRVFADIGASLKMKSPLCHHKSLDRPNLQITFKNKLTTSIETNFKEIESILNRDGATIVYGRTIKETEAVYEFLTNYFHQRESGNESKNKKSQRNNKVLLYHGSMNNSERESSHIQFLSGRARIIVATLAFGMGIDKPDIRNIIHWGAPKTVEEYFQQIGRAGRDGLLSECVLFSSPSEFSLYHSDFYTHGLSQTELKERLKSLNALKSLTESSSLCRRKALVDYFSFNDNKIAPVEDCNICDTCQNKKKYGNDMDRDFGDVANAIFRMIDAIPRQSLTKLTDVWKGTSSKMSSFHDKTSKMVSQEKEKIVHATQKTVNFLKIMIVSLKSEGYLSTSMIRLELSNGRSTNYEAYDLTEKAIALLKTGQKISVVLPVPHEIRKLEKAAEEKRQQKIKELEACGVVLKELPEKEKLDLDGPVSKAYLMWYHLIKRYSDRGSTEMVKALETMLERIENWRDVTAVALRMAPSAVLSPHMCRNLAYSRPTTVSGLQALGIRIKGVEDLATLIKESGAELGLEDQGSDDSDDSPVIRFPPGKFQSRRPWKIHASKPRKLAWEVSLERFRSGEPIDAIAAKQTKNPILVATVLGHLYQAAEAGYAIDFNLLLTYSQKITYKNLATYEAAIAKGKIDPTKEGYNEKALLCEILGESVNMEFSSKEESQIAKEKAVRHYCRLFTTIKRIGLSVLPQSSAEGEEGYSPKRMKS